MSRSGVWRRATLLAAVSAVLAVPGLLPAAQAGSAQAATAVTAAAAAPTVPPSALPPRTQVALTWTPEYMSSTHQFSQAEAVAIAKKFDVVAAVPAAFSPYLSAMRTANPTLKLVTYANAMFAGAADYAGLPESAFAHTVAGARITSVAYGTTLMEPSSSAWRNRSVSLCQSRIASSGYDGCLLDMLTMGVFAKNYVTALPAKPGAGRDYTQTEWRSGLITVGQAFSSALPANVIVGNAVGNYYRYWRAQVTSQPLAGSLPGAQMEDFMRGAADPVTKWPTASEWLDNVNVIKNLEAQGRTGLFSTKLWVGATAAEVKQWQAYSMASFLLQANGRSYFAFTPSRSKAGSVGGLNPYVMPTNLGSPTSAMTLKAGLYKRTFTGGLTVVNPGSTPITVTLTAPGTDLDGVTQVALTLPAHAGTILRGIAVDF